MESPLLLLSLAGFVGVIFFSFRAAHYTLGPASERERLSQAQTQFMMVDLAWLVVIMQVGLAVVVGYVPRHASELFYTFFFFAMFASTTLWWGTMRMVSRAGVRDPWRRGMFVVLVAPGTLGILVLSGPLLLLIFQRMARFLFSRNHWRVSDSFDSGFWLSVVYLLSIPLQMWLLRKGTDWALEDEHSLQLAAEAIARKEAKAQEDKLYLANLIRKGIDEFDEAVQEMEAEEREESDRR